MSIKSLVLYLSLLCLPLATTSSGTPTTINDAAWYCVGVEAMMSIDPALNADMKYIAIDMSKSSVLDKAEKEEVLKYFGKYHVETMEATFEQLEKKGLYDPKTQVLDGPLLQVEKIKRFGKKIIIDGSKYRAGDGAIGAKVILKYKNGQWQVEKAEMTWIS